jgi:hypothetical protein
MGLAAEDFHAIRDALAAIPGDVSSDAVGANVAKLNDIYAPETHAAALDPAIPVVLGSRGTGKSFWASVLGQADTRQAAARAYPRLNLGNVTVGFGFTGIGGPEGIGIDAVNSCVPADAGREQAKGFWWATILRAVSQAAGEPVAKLSSFLPTASDWEARDEILGTCEKRLRGEGTTLLIVYDALDRLATEWSRRRLLTEALLDVAWEMRAFRAIRIKLFFRPDQLEDDALRFVELPKLKTGAVRLEWSQIDLYGLVFSRLALAMDPARAAFGRLLQSRSIQVGSLDDVITRRWTLNRNREQQELIMADLAGPYMASGRWGFKKGKTYDWAFKHLTDAFREVTPRSFLGLMIAAAKYGFPPDNRVITPEGLTHGLRAASKTRVDQLHYDFAWIKGVLAPLAGLLLPQEEERVFSAWKSASTIAAVMTDAEAKKYLPPFPPKNEPTEADLYLALERIGVMERRKDGRIDMPDLFRVAAKLLKKGGTAPLRQ